MISSCITVLSYTGVLESQESRCQRRFSSYSFKTVLFTATEDWVGTPIFLFLCICVAPVETKSSSRLALIM
jgi:hypothetical protein